MSFIALNRRLAQPLPKLDFTTEASREFAAAQARKREARAKTPFRRALRAVLMGVAAVFLGIALVGGTAATSAQAITWPWEKADEVASGVFNWCNPINTPAPKNTAGPDAILLGLNKNQQGAIQQGAVVKPSTIDSPLNGIGQLRGNFADSANKDQLTQISKQGYSDYGLQTLKWTNYGSSCMSEGFAMTGIANLLLQFLVVIPASMAMAVVSFAMNNVLYDVFSAMISPFLQIFAKLLTPWVTLIVVMIGIPLAWIKGKGSLTKLLSATAWVAFMVSIFFYVSGNSVNVTRFMNNAVTNLTGFAACAMIANSDDATGFKNVASSGGGGGCAASFTPQNAISGQQSNLQLRESDGTTQAIWYSLPYTVWSMGQVGPEQAEKDRIDESAGKISWSAAILNGLYVPGGENADASRIVAARSLWNSGSYSTNEDADSGSKVSFWSTPKEADDWAKAGFDHPAKEIPFLTVVKALCADKSTSSGSGAGANGSTNNFMIGGTCDAPTAGTANIVETFQGNAYEQRLSAAISGGIVALMILVLLGWVSVYLIFQKFAFYFLMMFAPIFLAIGAFPDEKRGAFAKKFGEQFVANIIKQVVAVVLLIFVARSLSIVLSAAAIPWLLKPVAIMAFYLALVLFAIPTFHVMKKAARGEADVVDKTARLPATAVKTAAVVAGVAATAAVAAPILASSGALSSMGGLKGLAAAAPGALKKKGGQAAMQALSRGRGGLGRATRGANTLWQGMRDEAMGAQDRDQLGINALDAADRENHKRTNAYAFDRDASGNLTPLGRKQILDQYRGTTSRAAVANREKASNASKAFFNNYEAENNGAYHPLDPRLARTEDQNAAKLAAQEAADRDGSGPAWARRNGSTYAPGQTQQELEARLGGREAAAAGDPVEVLGAYKGHPANIDPRHPAAAAIIGALWADTYGDEDAKAASVQAMRAAIATDGLPGVITSAGSSVSPEAFEKQGGLGHLGKIIPALKNDTPGAELDDPAVRLEWAAAYTQIAATVPQGHTLHAQVDKLRQVVLDPDSTMFQVGAEATLLEAQLASYEKALREVPRDRTLRGTDGFEPGFVDLPERAPRAEDAPASPRRAARAAAVIEGEAPTAQLPATEEPAPFVPARTSAPSPSREATMASRVAEAPAPTAASPAPVVMEGRPSSLEDIRLAAQTGAAKALGDRVAGLEPRATTSAPAAAPVIFTDLIEQAPPAEKSEPREEPTARDEAPEAESGADSIFHGAGARRRRGRKSPFPAPADSTDEEN